MTTPSGLLPIDQLINQDLDDLIRKARPQFEALAGNHVWLPGAAVLFQWPIDSTR